MMFRILRSNRLFFRVMNRRDAIFHVRSHALDGETRGRFFMESSLHRFERESGRASPVVTRVARKPTPDRLHARKVAPRDVARLVRERFSFRLNISIQRVARVHDSSRLFRTTSSPFHGSSHFFILAIRKQRKNSRSLYRSFTRCSVMRLSYFM